MIFFTHEIETQILMTLNYCLTLNLFSFFLHFPCRFVWYPSLLLGFLNCAYNPIIYCLLSKNFRQGFKSVLCCCRYCHFPKIARVFSSRTPTTRLTRPTNVEDVAQKKPCTVEVTLRFYHSYLKMQNVSKVLQQWPNAENFPVFIGIPFMEKRDE